MNSYSQLSSYFRIHDEDSDDETEAMSPLINDSSYVFGNNSKFTDISESKNFKKPYRLWYSFTINSLPNQAIQTMELISTVNLSSTIEILLKNPLHEELTLNVILEGDEVYGERAVSIPPLSTLLYQVTYSPTSAGHSKGR